MNTKLHFKNFGQGDPLVILHGLFGTLDNWNGMAKILSERFCVFTVDLRNHGQSFHDDEMNYKVMVNDLVDFLQSEWIYECHLIGHSMGGKLAMQFACDNPDIVKSLVVSDISPKKYKEGHGDIFNALNSIDLETVTKRSDVQNVLESLGFEPAIVLFLMKNLHFNTITDEYEWKMNLPVLTKNYPQLMGEVCAGQKYDGPTLFLKGDHSDYITSEDYPLLDKIFKHNQVQTVLNSGHWIHADNPGGFLQELNKFYNTLAIP